MDFQSALLATVTALCAAVVYQTRRKELAADKAALEEARARAEYIASSERRIAEIIAANKLFTENLVAAHKIEKELLIAANKSAQVDFCSQIGRLCDAIDAMQGELKSVWGSMDRNTRSVIMSFLGSRAAVELKDSAQGVIYELDRIHPDENKGGKNQ